MYLKRNYRILKTTKPFGIDKTLPSNLERKKTVSTKAKIYLYFLIFLSGLLTYQEAFEPIRAYLDKVWPILVILGGSWLTLVDLGLSLFIFVDLGWSCLDLVDLGWFWLIMVDIDRSFLFGNISWFWLILVQLGWSLVDF